MKQSPNTEVFEELRRGAIEVWSTYDDQFGYATEKITRVNSIKNVADNYGTFIGMFDVKNQEKLYALVGDDAKALIDQWVGGLDRIVTMAKSMGMY